MPQCMATLVGGECSHHCAIPAPLNCTAFRHILFLIVLVRHRGVSKYSGTRLIRTPRGHAKVSVLSGLILEKMYELFRVGTNENVRNIRVSVERGSTVPWIYFQFFLQ